MGWGQVRLLEVTSERATVKRVVAAPPQYSRDEQLYYRVRDGVVSVGGVEGGGGGGGVAPPYRLIVCSATEPAPMLVNIVTSLSAHTLNPPNNPAVGTAATYAGRVSALLDIVRYSPSNPAVGTPRRPQRTLADVNNFYIVT